MKINTDPIKIWEEYQNGVNYNAAIDLYENVTTNENFYVGKQWEGVNAPDLPKPTLNFLKRVVSYFIAMLVTDDIAASLKPFEPDIETEKMSAAVSADITRVIEQERAKEKNRDAIRNAAVDGDACFYLWYDPTRESGQYVKGDIRVEVIPNINCIFGNPYLNEVQEQPYIIIAMRRMVCEVRDEADENGKDAEAIMGDSDANQNEQDSGDQLCTVLVKLWKKRNEDGTSTIMAIKTTDRTVIKDEWDTGLALYPVAWMNWEKIMASYHGQAALTGLIQNQIAVNRLYAMMIRSVELNAFPKILFDQAKFPRGWTNRVGEAIGVTGNPNESFANVFRGADVSEQVSGVIEKLVSMTRDFMGASDAALGNVTPDNTSAIIAVQQASAVPIEINRRAFYDFVEQYIRIMVDMMRANYGVRDVNIELDSAKLADIQANQTPMPLEGMMDHPSVKPFDSLPGADQMGMQPPPMSDTPIGTMQGGYDPFGATQASTDTIKTRASIDYSKINPAMLNVDIGSAAYWSEIMQMQTMDNLIENGIIQDFALYLESIPDKYLPNKTKLIESVKSRQAQQDMMNASAPMGSGFSFDETGNAPIGDIQ